MKFLTLYEGREYGWSPSNVLLVIASPERDEAIPSQAVRWLRLQRYL